MIIFMKNKMTLRMLKDFVINSNKKGYFAFCVMCLMHRAKSSIKFNSNPSSNSIRKQNFKFILEQQHISHFKYLII